MAPSKRSRPSSSAKRRTKHPKKPTRPETTLFLTLSVDGRITSHDSDDFDPDKNWKNLPGIRALLHQFYEFNEPNMHALTTGGFMKNLGVNTRQGTIKKEDLSLIVLDPDADLTPQGVKYLTSNLKHLYFVCLANHPIISHLKRTRIYPNLYILGYETEIDLNDVFQKLYLKHKVNHLFIHSIAPLNADLLDAGLIDHLSVIISPLLVGGHGTPALQDSDIMGIRPLQLTGWQAFSQNFINLRYDVTNT